MSGGRGNISPGGWGCYSFKQKLTLTNMNDDQRNVQITGPTIMFSLSQCAVQA